MVAFKNLPLLPDMQKTMSVMTSLKDRSDKKAKLERGEEHKKEEETEDKK